MQIIKANTTEELDAVRELFTEYQQFLGFSLCFQGFDEELKKLPYKYAEPDGTILLATVDGETAGVVALWKLEEGICEMKRLYVRPKFQGIGLGRKLAVSIIEEARKKGYFKMKLDTVKRLETAISMYKSLGFIETKPYNYNPEDDVKYFEMEL